MITIEDVINNEKELYQKYGSEDIDEWSDEEYKGYTALRNELEQTSGLTDNEFMILRDCREYKLTNAIKNLLLRITEKMKKEGIKSKQEFTDFTGYSDIWLL